MFCGCPAPIEGLPLTCAPAANITVVDAAPNSYYWRVGTFDCRYYHLNRRCCRNESIKNRYSDSVLIDLVENIFSQESHKVDFRFYGIFLFNDKVSLQ